MSDKNFSPSKAFEALTPQPITSHWNTSRNGVRVGVEQPRAGLLASSMRQAFIELHDNVDAYDAEQLAFFFAKLAVHLGNDTVVVVQFADKGGFA